MPLRHRTVGSSRSRIIVVPCVLTTQLPPCAIAHLTPTHSPSSPYSLSIAFHHFPDALAISLSFPHRPSPILTTFLSMTCVLKCFPLTSPRKLTLPCVKRGFLRTSGLHCTSQLSPCGTPGVAVPCLCDAWQGCAIATTEQHIDELFADWELRNN